jgi:hypothetical protein
LIMFVWVDGRLFIREYVDKITSLRCGGIDMSVRFGRNFSYSVI